MHKYMRTNSNQVLFSSFYIYDEVKEDEITEHGSIYETNGRDQSPQARNLPPPIYHPPSPTYSHPRPAYSFQPPPSYRPPPVYHPTPPTNMQVPVEVVLTGVQIQPANIPQSQQNKPAFKLSNKTNMNLDGPGYALTLLLVGINITSPHAWYSHSNISGEILILGMAFLSGLGTGQSSRSMVGDEVIVIV